MDISLPGRRIENGGHHPVTRTCIDRIESFFGELGFTVATVRRRYYTSDALNIPGHHRPAPIMIPSGFDATRLLRTQTSGVQIGRWRAATADRIIAPGRGMP
ncbi:hypothetical protein KCP75_08740 [Salmonella enterica subsp. enterica]|nr:hypothetical protein KCP75_08740 [Salmonella enterica subsp. enterica]